MKNSMFLMLVLLHITSQSALPAQPAIASGVPVLTLIAFGTIGVASIGLGFQICNEWYTRFQGMQCVQMPEGRKKEKCVFDLLDTMWGFPRYEIRIATTLGLNIDSRSKYNLTALRREVCRGNQEGVEFFLKNGADVNYKDPTPLSRAIVYGNPDVVACVINHGAEIGEDDIGSILGILRRGCPRQEGTGECEDSQNQFKKYLLRKRTKKYDKEIDMIFYRIPEVLNGMISGLAMSETSGEDYVRVAAQIVSACGKMKKTRIRNKLKAVAAVTISAIIMFLEPWDIVRR